MRSLTLVRGNVQVCWILPSSWALHPAPAETKTRRPPLRFHGSFVLHLASPYLSLWHRPPLHLGHLVFPLRSGCASPVSCGREPGHIPREDGGLGAAGRGIPWA